MNPKNTLDGQVILKKGRLNNFGYEPAWNSYFDFYISEKYVSPQLIRLEDAMFHLFLRKNLNTRNPEWKMPSIRQMMRRLCVGQKKIQSMMFNLERVHLLTKESGYRKGERGENIQNTYILSDPIQTLEEFVAVAQENLFPYPLRTEWHVDTPCMPEAYTPVCPEHIDPVSPMHTQKQTLKTEHTLGEQVDPRLQELRFSVGEKTYDRFMTGAEILSVEDGVAVIGTSYSYAKDFIENRLANKLKYALKVDAIKCVVLTE